METLKDNLPGIEIKADVKAELLIYVIPISLATFYALYVVSTNAVYGVSARLWLQEFQNCLLIIYSALILNRQYHAGMYGSKSPAPAAAEQASYDHLELEEQLDRLANEYVREQQRKTFDRVRDDEVRRPDATALFDEAYADEYGEGDLEILDAAFGEHGESLQLRESED